MGASLSDQSQRKAASAILGRAPEGLTLPERIAHAGQWIAVEIYRESSLKEEGGVVQVDLRLRRIRAVGDSVEDCMRQLQQAGLDPGQFEFSLLKLPY